MPEKPKALSPSTAITCSPLTTAAATEKPIPTPITPQVPTSRRFRGLYMSTMLRVKSSAFAPSLTRMASGFALTMSRTTLSALWKFIGVGFLASASAIFATFLVLRSAMALSQSAGGFSQFDPSAALIAASIADTHEPMSPTTGASIRTLLSASCGEMSIWMNFRSPQSFGLLPPHVLPLPCESSQFERALHGVRRRDLARRRIDHPDQRLPSCFRVDRLRKQLGRQVEIDAARTTGESSADRPRHAHADVLGVQDAERGLGVRPGDCELVHLLVVALLQVDDLALARAADEDHREAIGGGVGERRQSIEKA